MRPLPNYIGVWLFLSRFVFLIQLSIFVCLDLATSFLVQTYISRVSGNISQGHGVKIKVIAAKSYSAQVCAPLGKQLYTFSLHNVMTVLEGYQYNKIGARRRELFLEDYNSV